MDDLEYTKGFDPETLLFTVSDEETLESAYAKLSYIFESTRDSFHEKDQLCREQIDNYLQNVELAKKQLDLIKSGLEILRAQATS